jgi:hypothetical protein
VASDASFWAIPIVRRDSDRADPGTRFVAGALAHTAPLRAIAFPEAIRETARPRTMNNTRVVTSDIAIGISLVSAAIGGYGAISSHRALRWQRARAAERRAARRT